MTQQMYKVIAGIHANRRWIVVALICFFSFVGGLLASKAEEVVEIRGLWQQTDMEWARENNLVESGMDETKAITQAEFLKMLIVAYAPKEEGFIVPLGAENHWAAGFYATAKKEGIIGCSCIIKPDSTITVKEAVDFVVQAITHSERGKSLGQEEVRERLAGKNKGGNQITVKESAGLIRKMEEMRKGIS